MDIVSNLRKFTRWVFNSLDILLYLLSVKVIGGQCHIKYNNWLDILIEALGIFPSTHTTKGSIIAFGVGGDFPTVFINSSSKIRQNYCFCSCDSMVVHDWYFQLRDMTWPNDTVILPVSLFGPWFHSVNSSWILW